MTSSAIIIPTRYNSTRFPGKPLVDLGGKTMIERVYEACKETGYDTYVLTDDMRIGGIFGWNVCWIDQEVPYENGTERCAGAINGSLLSGYTSFINVQCDMPDVTKEMIDKVDWHLKHYPITTLWTDMQPNKRQDPNTVKVVTAGDKALWFSRGLEYGEHHLGIYGYRANALNMYTGMPTTREEHNEGLEQLRWLKGGWDIGILHCEFNGIEINTPEDAEEWNAGR